MRWTGSAASATDLHPTSGAYTDTTAYGIDGVHQVGDGFTGTVNHALLWSGTADSVIDLHPAGYVSSAAYGVAASQQVGFAQFRQGNGTTVEHAMMWSGTPNSFIDLHPTDLTGFSGSEALATNGGQQVGYIDGPGFTRAVIWQGTAGSAVDLEDSLPAGLSHSIAYSIDANGNVFGTANTANGQVYVVEWAATPEPSGALLLVAAGGATLLWRRKRSS